MEKQEEKIEIRRVYPADYVEEEERDEKLVVKKGKRKVSRLKMIFGLTIALVIYAMMITSGGYDADNPGILLSVILIAYVSVNTP